jgi:ESCRT-II complex subunit VPS36
VELFGPLRLPLQFREFPSGVAVVQDESWNDDAACDRVLTALNKPGPSGAVEAAFGRGLRAAQFALEEQIPLAVATEHMLLAERHGMVCRDECAQGLTFYRNIFMQVQL